MDERLLCTNDTIEEGTCYGLAVCGFCYGATPSMEEEMQEATSWEYEHFNLLVIGILLPTIGCLGLVGDTISAFIYSRREMISSLNVYLCALACSDIVIILTAFFLFFLENMRKRIFSANYYFAVLAPFMFPVGLTAQTLSVFLTVAAAFDCFVLVAGRPSIRDVFCTTRSSLKMLGVIFFLACCYNSPHVFEIIVIDCWSVQHGAVSKDVCPTELRNDENYVKIYYAYMYTLVMAAGPVFLLVIINTAIVISMRRQESPEGDVFTLVLVVCLFVTCNVPPLTVNLLEMLFSLVNPFLIDLSNLLVVVNSSCNFLIYYAFGQNFRRTLQQYFINFVRQKKKAAPLQSIPIHRLQQPPKEFLI